MLNHLNKPRIRKSLIPKQSILFLFLLLCSSFAWSATTLKATTINSSTGTFKLDWTSTTTFYGSNVFENGIKIAGVTTPTYTVTGKQNGTYSYYVETCYQSCTRSNTVYMTIYDNPGQSETPISLSQMSANFESNLGTWRNTGTYDWIRRANGTPSGNTGPSRAPQGSSYIYFETSSGHAYRSGDSVELTSSNVVLNNDSFLTFKYHMYGADIGSLKVEVFNDGFWTNIWEKSSQQQSSSGSSWKAAAISLDRFSGISKLRFVAIAKGGYRGDIALDDISFATSDAAVFASGKAQPYRPINENELPISANDLGTAPSQTTHSVPTRFKTNTVVDQYKKITEYVPQTYSSSQLNGNRGDCFECVNRVSQMREIAENYAFEPFYKGQRKSMSSIVRDKAGNAVELAGRYLYSVKSLSGGNGVDVQFVFGRIQIEVEKLKSWLGVDDIETAARIIRVGGGNPLMRTQNGVPVYVEMDHVWTEVGGVAVDPSYQVKTVPVIKNIQRDAGVDPAGILNGLDAAGVFDDPDGIMSPDLAVFDDLLELNENTVAQYLSSNPQVTYSDYLSEKSISLSSYQYGDTLPYNVVSVSNKYLVPNLSSPYEQMFDTLPTLKRERLKVRTNGVNYTLKMDKALDSSVVIDYVAATSQDQSIINSYGGLLNTPYKGVNLKPRLLINGSVVATGNPIEVGEYHTITVEMLDADESSNTCSPTNREDCKDIVNHNVTVGGVHAIALDGQYIDGDSLTQQATVLEQLSQTYSSNLLDSRFSGPLLSYLGRSYHRQLDIEIQNASSSSGALIFHEVNEAIVSIDLSARLVSDGSYRMSVGSRAIDAPRNIFAILPNRSSNTFDAAAILFSLGQAASALEHAVFAKSVGWPAESTMSILRYAASHEQSIYTINQSNKNRILPLLEYEQPILNNIETLVDQGRIIITPPGPQVIGDWSGYGFIALDSATGAAAFVINGGAAGGKQHFGTLDLQQTNMTLAEDVNNILLALSASVDGALYGTNNDTLYNTSLEQNWADGIAFATDFLIVGDIRNLGISSYDAAFNNGSIGDVGMSAIAFVPIYDGVKGVYKVGDNVFDIKGLDNVLAALDNVSDFGSVYLGNLTRNANVFGATSRQLDGSIDTLVTSASRNGLDFKNVIVKDANAFSNSLGMNLNQLTSTGAKGEFGERAAQSWARSNGLTCYFCSADTSAQGFDNIFKDVDGNFIVSESKWITSASNVGVGALSNTNSGRQLSGSWMFDGGLNGSNAMNRTPGLTLAQRIELNNAFDSGKVKTQLFIVKPKHRGAGITKRLADDATFGSSGTEKLGDIVIMEIPID